MKSSRWIVLTLLFVGCSTTVPTDDATSKPNRPIPKSEQFFSDWFKNHGHADVVADSNGVGIDGNPTRLNASLYGSDQKPDSCVIETEFRIQLESGREIIEFLAGTGTDEEAAINDSLLNFLLTTFHPVYKAFINADDPHLDSEVIEIDGIKREVILGDLYARSSEQSTRLDLHEMRPQILEALKGVQMSREPHWIKIAYLQVDNQPKIVSATFDNGERQSLNDQIAKLKWPKSDGPYMAKQFIVIK